MAKLEAQFPSWLVDRIERQGFATAIAVLNLAGDSAGSKAHFQSLATRLTSWGVTVRNQPSTAALTPIIAPV